MSDLALPGVPEPKPSRSAKFEGEPRAWPKWEKVDSASATTATRRDPQIESFAGIEARLDELSQQMDLVLAELSSWKSLRQDGGSTSFHSSFLTVIPGARGSTIGPPSARASRASRASHASRASRKSRASQRSGGGSDKSITAVADPQAEVKRGTVQSARQAVAAPKAMDLACAWRLHAEELEDGEYSNTERERAKSSAQTLWRLVERSRADVLWEMLDDPRSSPTAWFVSQFLKAMVIFSVLWSNLQMTEKEVLDPFVALVLELVIDTIFTAEFACRVLSAPSKRNYFMDLLNWADILSALGLPLRAAIGFAIEPAEGAVNVVQHFLRFAMPVVRFVKLLRYFESFRLLMDACRRSAEALPVLIYMTCLIVMVSATAIFLGETRESIPSMPHSLWLALVTMTTVGYGDFYPRSLAGYLTVAVLTFVSVLFLALPVGIIGHEFTMTWKSRTQVLLMMRFRRALDKWGYGAKDLRVLIEYVDVNGEGELFFEDFVELIKQMRIGISTEEASLLFGYFDLDQNGMVDHAELMKHLFPEDYMKLELEGRMSRSSRQSRVRVSDAMEILAQGPPPKEEEALSEPDAHSS
eukprot:s392_g14.t1